MTNPNRLWRSWPALAGCAALLCMAAAMETVSQPTGVAKGYLVDGKQRDASVLQAAGEFRIVAANIIWAKVVDHYHHTYMAGGGDWEKNQSLLPLLQTIIDLDPHFVEAYELMGGTILPKTGRFAQGRQVLAEGIKNNPYDWEMYREMAMLYAWDGKQPALALPFAETGLAQANDDFSRRLMGKLCVTLRSRVKEKNDHPATPANAAPLAPPRKPEIAESPPQPRPSA